MNIPHVNFHASCDLNNKVAMGTRVVDHVAVLQRFDGGDRMIDLR